MNKYLVLFDNLVTDDLLVSIIYAKDYDECWEKAYARSLSTGYSEGNFEIFESVDERMARQTMADMEVVCDVDKKM